MNFLNFQKIENTGDKQNDFLGLKIFIIGNDEHIKKFYESIFISKITNKDYNKRSEKEFKTDQIYWIAKFYKDLTKNNISSIIEEIIFDKNKQKWPNIFQHVILFFDNNNQNNFELFIKESYGAYEPCFIIMSNSMDELKIDNFRRIKIVNIIMDNMSEQEINIKIITSLWECDCYFNERGNEICKYTPSNIVNIFINNLSFFTINVLLTGKSRSGKSAFINNLSNKMISLESNIKDLVTKKITEYFIYTLMEIEKKIFLN